MEHIKILSNKRLNLEKMDWFSYIGQESVMKEPNETICPGSQEVPSLENLIMAYKNTRHEKSAKPTWEAEDHGSWIKISIHCEMRGDYRKSYYSYVPLAMYKFWPPEGLPSWIHVLIKKGSPAVCIVVRRVWLWYICIKLTVMDNSYLRRPPDRNPVLSLPQTFLLILTCVFLKMY